MKQMNLVEYCLSVLRSPLDHRYRSDRFMDLFGNSKKIYMSQVKTVLFFIDM